MQKLYVFDTTLRDGEQSLGITLDVNEKLEICHQLVKLGVDVIEAGFPASSPGDFKSVQTIAKKIKGASICGLSRVVPEDIDICAEALKGSECPRIHTGVAVSPLHMEKKLGLNPQQVIDISVAAVKRSKKYVSDVEFYAEDAFRSDRNFLVRILEEVIAAGATVVNIPDTVGYATPWEYGQMVSYVLNNVRNIDKAVISVHCHNDLGMATANTMAGILAGARQVEGTINGIGERAGNTALEEVIMALYAQRYTYKLDSNINTREISATSRIVSRITGVPVPSHKAIVGANAFSHASGIHQDGVLKERETYEIIDPEVVGIPRNHITLTARSGRHALRHRLVELGYSVSKSDMSAVYGKFLNLADRKKEVFDEDLHALMGNSGAGNNNIQVKELSATSDRGSAFATVTMEVRGQIMTNTARGNGPVDAVFKAINQTLGLQVKLEEYSLKSVSEGTESLGDALVKIRHDGSLYVGRGVSTDVLEASALAYVNALIRTGMEYMGYNGDVEQKSEII